MSTESGNTKEEKVTVPPIQFVSVICWDGSFRENFDAVRCALNQTLPADRCEVIFVEFFETVNPAIEQLMAGHPNATAVALGNPHPGRENEHLIGACVNEALRRARGDLIAIPDADVLFEDDFLEEAIGEHERVRDLALYFYRMDEQRSDKPVERSIEAIRRVGSIQFPDNFGGCLTVRREWLDRINGYEEDPLWRGYSSVDQDVARRLKSLGLCIKWHPTKFLYHGYHPGCHRPDPKSVERIQMQRAIYEGRLKALETLPYKGLRPEVQPKWRYDPSAPSRPGQPRSTRKRGPVKAALRKVVHALVPRPVRRKVVGLFSDDIW